MDSEILSNTRSLNARAADQIADVYKGNYNCWGYTALIHNWVDEPYWLDQSEMEVFLKHNTTHTYPSRARRGDIAVYRDEQSNELTHTAIVLGPNQLIHKPGSYEVKVEQFDTELYGKPCEFRKIKETHKEVIEPLPKWELHP